MDQVRLRAFVTEAATTKTVGDRLMEAQARGGSRVKDYEALKQRKLEVRWPSLFCPPRLAELTLRRA